MDSLHERSQKIFEKLQLDDKRKQVRLLEAEASKPEFWQDHQQAAIKMKQLSNLQKEIEEVQSLQQCLEQGDIKKAEKLIKKLENILYLSGSYDKNYAIVSIHAGQGGVEAMDWAQMLFRMYTRYFEKKGFTHEIIDQTYGEEAGIKSITLAVEGIYAYGYLKGEAGVHRLVRLSPFNADNLRQTSFALVEVLPLVEESTEAEIKEDDLEWEFYRASSHGGQNVQKVSTAVRLRHKPTGIVVTAQSERYQGQNREYALKILQAKILLLKEEERKRQEQALKGSYKTPGWGNQIRSYVLHPYHLVKDVRTNYETSNTEAVLNGEIDEFIQEELRLLS